MDITMCEGSNCPLKEKCLRFKGESNKYRQSYFMEIPYKDNNCEFYYEIKDDTPMTEKEEMRLFITNLFKKLHIFAKSKII